MSTITRYLVEYDPDVVDGETTYTESDEFETFFAADDFARRNDGRVVEYEYEFSDSSVVADYTNS